MATDTSETAPPVEETTPPAAPEAPVTDSGTPPVDDSPVQPEVVSQDGALVGDEAIADATENPVQVAVVNETTAAQVSPPRQAAAATVPVNETHVATDRVITDPSSPEASIVPDAGRSPLLTQGLPISRLNAPTVEDVFAKEASEADESTSSSA